MSACGKRCQPLLHSLPLAAYLPANQCSPMQQRCIGAPSTCLCFMSPRRVMSSPTHPAGVEMLLARGARPDLQCHVSALAASGAAVGGGGEQQREQEQGQPLGPLLPLLVGDSGNTVLSVCTALVSTGGGRGDACMWLRAVPVWLRYGSAWASHVLAVYRTGLPSCGVARDDVRLAWLCEALEAIRYSLHHPPLPPANCNPFAWHPIPRPFILSLLTR